MEIITNPNQIIENLGGGQSQYSKRDKKTDAK